NAFVTVWMILIALLLALIWVVAEIIHIVPIVVLDRIADFCSDGRKRVLMEKETLPQAPNNPLSSGEQRTLQEEAPTHQAPSVPTADELVAEAKQSAGFDTNLPVQQV